jgi:hypothetical protein
LPDHILRQELATCRVLAARPGYADVVFLVFLEPFQTDARTQYWQQSRYAIYSYSVLSHLTLCNLYSSTRSRGSSVGIATDYGLDLWFGVRVLVGSRIFSTSSVPVLGFTQTPVKFVSGVKRLGREADRSPRTSNFNRRT